MSNNVSAHRSPYDVFSGPNLGYVMEMYENFKEDPESVSPDMAEFFRYYGAPVMTGATGAHAQAAAEVPEGDFGKVLAAYTLIDAIRNYGHLAADIYPLKDRPQDTTRIELSYYGLTEADLEKMPAALFLQEVPATVENGLDAVNYLKSLYTGKIAYEFGHVIDEEERKWLLSQVETKAYKPTFNAEEKKELLERLTKVEGFEKFIHRTFIGAKRFSIEGLDTLVTFLEELVRRSESDAVKKMLIAMAHRGRLNVLTHILNKPYEMMFAEFAGVPPEPFLPEDGSLEVTSGWYGDVKYHMGALYKGEKMDRFLAYNPSHLEVANPVIAGQTRAAQEDTSQPGAPTRNEKEAYAVMIHGDAAFPGQGVVPETFNFSRIEGYRTGGSIHVIANNMIGFTTEFWDSRSTMYSSDPAKGFEVPVMHVNADDPEAVIESAALAFEYRQKFGKDIIVDLIGYRRYGHNEMDEPLVTNPMMYHLVHKHPTVRELYGQRLVEEGVMTAEQVEELDEKIFKMMQAANDRVKEESKDAEPHVNDTPAYVLEGIEPNIETGVERERLEKMNEELLTYPEDFTVFSKLGRILQRRELPFTNPEKGKIDWAHAEQLAFGSILQEGKPVRLSGEDVQRGTFAHRHLVLNDEKTGKQYTPLQHISGSKASIVAYNSPLTEFALVGFEWGYTLENKKGLTIWEAQYGDFANMAQPMFDQFVSSSLSKWGQQSGLVLLLPHAYEGQGPEHSSARLERFLQLSAENNWTVANISSAANYFHVLRRQAAIVGTEQERPLVIMSPKSLLRHPLVGADVEDLTKGSFQTVLEQQGTGQNPEKVEKILFASGKMAIDLAEQVKDGEGFDHLHIVRVEQLYPFPEARIQEIIARFPNAKKLVWVQEEPRNMGSYSYALPYLLDIAEGRTIEYVGRIHRASPSEGDGASHTKEQKRIVADALKKDE